MARELIHAWLIWRSLALTRRMRVPGPAEDRRCPVPTLRMRMGRGTCLLPWSLPTECVQNRFFLCFVLPRSDAVRNLVPRFDRVRCLTPDLPRSFLAVSHELNWGAPCRFLARPGCTARRCRRTEARKPRIEDDRLAASGLSTRSLSPVSIRGNAVRLTCGPDIDLFQVKGQQYLLMCCAAPSR
jgi:hypothetical protein